MIPSTHCTTRGSRCLSTYVRTSRRRDSFHVLLLQTVVLVYNSLCRSPRVDTHSLHRSWVSLSNSQVSLFVLLLFSFTHGATSLLVSLVCLAPVSVKTANGRWHKYFDYLSNVMRVKGWSISSPLLRVTESNSPLLRLY